MKVRIFNDGKAGYQTQLTDVETGKTIEHATGVDVRLTIDVRDMPKALITVIAPVVDVIADAEIRQVCPVCGKPTETSPTPQSQHAHVVAMVEEWEEGVKAEREREQEQREVERQKRMIIEQAMYRIVSFALKQMDANDEVARRIDEVTQDTLHLLNNLS